MNDRKYLDMYDELMKHTVKELKAIAKRDGICLGYAASRKDTLVAAIVGGRRYQELTGAVPEGHDWHMSGVTAYQGIKGGSNA